MRFVTASKIGLLAAALSLCLPAQNTPAKEEAKGLPPRAAPTDYQAHVQAGAVTIAAEFAGHSIPTAEGPLSTEDYIVVETALFGAPGTRLTLSADDFTLRINGKKSPLPSQPFGLVVATVKDPEWQPPEPPAPKSKTSLGGGGGGGGRQPGEPPPAPPPVPIGVQRAMAQRVQKAALPEGDRPLPQAGLLFFQHHGKIQGIRSVELVYAGPAGKATLALHP